MPRTEEVVTQPHRRNQLLKQLVQYRSHLTLLLPERTEPMTSTLLEVDSTGECLLLDEFLPSFAMHSLVPEDRISIHSKLKGIPIQFETRFNQLDNNEDGSFLVCELPKSLTYHQKRQHYRLVNPPSGGRQNFAFDIESDEFTGRMKDLSVDGANVLLKTDTPIERGQEIDHTHFFLNDELHFDTSVEVCHISEDGKRAGVRFLTLEDSDRSDIQHWIFEIERDLLRG